MDMFFKGLIFAGAYYDGLQNKCFFVAAKMQVGSFTFRILSEVNMSC